MAPILRILFLQSALLVLLCSGQTTQAPTMITGVFNGSVTLKCDLDHSDPAKVTWWDTVYNQGREPALIFNSENNPDMEFDSTHPNKDNFKIDDKYSLTISGLKENDVGLYYCQSVKGGSTTEMKYNLNLASKPKCQGNTDLVEGGKTMLSCSASFVGNGITPEMEWYANDNVIKANDDTDFGIVKMSADIDATSDKDKVEYTCKVMLGTLVDQCSLKLSVKYLVRNIEITPKKAEYSVGDTLKCKAAGNPSPSITWMPQGEGGSEGPGWRSLVIKEEWEGKPMTLKCLASNSFNGEKDAVSQNITFTAGKAKEPEPEPKPASGDGNQIAGIVAGLIIGAVVLVIIIIAIVCIRRKQSKKPKGAKPVPTHDEDLKRHEHHNMDGKGGEPVELTKFQPRKDNLEKDTEDVEPLKDSFDDTLDKKASNNDTLPIRGPASDDDDNDVTGPPFVANGDSKINDGKPSVIDTDDLDALLKDLQNSVP